MKSEAGAIAFVKYFLELNNLAYMRSDPELLRRVSAIGCEVCESLIADVEELQRLGRHYNQPVVALDSAKYLGANSSTQFLVSAQVTQQRSSVVDSDGKVILTDPKKVLKRTFEVTWQSGSWLVSAVG